MIEALRSSRTLPEPITGSDVNAVTISSVQSFADKTMHQTVSFDGGKVNVNTLNNGEGWDAVVKIVDPGTKKLVASGRTYGRQDVYEVDPGVYDVQLTALNIDGLEV